MADCEIKRLADELTDCKRKYLAIKKRELYRAEIERAEARSIEPEGKDGPRFTGGGFNLKQTAGMKRIVI